MFQTTNQIFSYLTMILTTLQDLVSEPILPILYRAFLGGGQWSTSNIEVSLSTFALKIGFAVFVTFEVGAGKVCGTNGGCSEGRHGGLGTQERSCSPAE